MVEERLIEMRRLLFEVEEARHLIDDDLPARKVAEIAAQHRCVSGEHNHMAVIGIVGWQSFDLASDRIAPIARLAADRPDPWLRAIDRGPHVDFSSKLFKSINALDNK